MQARMRKFSLLRRIVPLTIGSTFLLSGCDPTIQSTVEDGIINISTSFLSSFLQALIQVGAQQGAM